MNSPFREKAGIRRQPFNAASMGNDPTVICNARPAPRQNNTSLGNLSRVLSSEDFGSNGIKRYRLPFKQGEQGRSCLLAFSVPSLSDKVSK